MGGRGSSSLGSRTFNHLSEANTFFGVGGTGMYPEWEQAATQDERDAAIYYTTNAYREINAHLRGKDGKTLENASDKVKQSVANIDKAMAKFNLTQNITVFRGGSNRLVGGASTLEEVKALKGAIVRDRGIMSTAVTYGAAWDKSGGNIGYEIEIPKGKGRGIFIDPISAHKGEQEFMVARDTQFKVVGGYTDTHGNVICKLRAVYGRKK